MQSLPMRLADLKLRIAGLEKEHGPEILDEPLFVGQAQSGDTVLATSLEVFIATSWASKRALKDAGYASQSKIGVILT